MTVDEGRPGRIELLASRTELSLVVEEKAQMQDLDGDASRARVNWAARFSAVVAAIGVISALSVNRLAHMIRNGEMPSIVLMPSKAALKHQANAEVEARDHIAKIVSERPFYPTRPEGLSQITRTERPPGDLVMTSMSRPSILNPQFPLSLALRAEISGEDETGR